MTKDKSKRRTRSGDPLESDLARDIDANLKRVYAAVLEEKVPDRFTELLKQLREKEGKDDR